MLMPIVPTFVRSFETAWSKTLTSNVSSNTRTAVLKMLPAAFAATGSMVKVRLQAATTGAMTVAACYIGPSATTGSAWNFASSPTQVTFAGSGTVVIAASGSVLSDAISYDSAAGGSISLAIDVTSSPIRSINSGAGSNFITYAKNGVAEAASQTKGGSYVATSGRIYVFSELLVA